MDEGGDAGGDGIEAGPSRGVGAVAVAVGWIVAAGALGWAAGMLPAGWAPGALWARVALALGLTAPLVGAWGWAALAARISAAERRVEGVRRVVSRPAPTPETPPGTEALSRAVAHAARDALDRERGAIARQLAELGETQRRLDAALTEIGQAFARPPSAPLEAVPTPEPGAEAEARLEEAGPARRSGAIPSSPPRPEEPEDAAQGALPLSAEEAVETEPFDWEIAARALDFPRDASDDAGFAALAAATRDRQTRELLQAAEDALTLLAQHGLYMEDLEVRHAPASAWRRFADGARGPEVRAVGGVAAHEAVSGTRALLKSDPVFRDTAMHLMRRYDGLLRRAAASPRGETAMLAMADSRTGRAFMLAAQAVGAFD